MPKCIYVRIPGSSDSFLQAGTHGAAQLGAMDLTGVLAIQPQARPWNFKPAGCKTSVKISRTQVPLLPRKQCTLHGVQGKTAEPGLIYYFRTPRRPSNVMKWVSCYMALSRVRTLRELRSIGLTPAIRELIDEGPPDGFLTRFLKVFDNKILQTQTDIEEVLTELGWSTVL